MARKNRRETMRYDVPGVYHITSRCVRRAFLCGVDSRSGKDYSHRREWLEDRVKELAAHFAIEIIFIAVLANHFHLLLANLPQLVAVWTDAEVIRRACKIFPWKFGQLGVEHGEPTEMQLRQLTADTKLVAEMRMRLSDPSWFMKQLKQSLAVASNSEDSASGHFFEGRFRHRNVTDETGLFICGVYIDLNQIAACEATTPEESLHTSAGMRIAGQLLRAQGRQQDAALRDGFLSPIGVDRDGQQYASAGAMGSLRASDQSRLEITLDQYLATLDVVGRLRRPGKAGVIPSELPPILERLGLTPQSLTAFVDQYDSLFHTAVGLGGSLAAFAARLGQRWLQGVQAVLGIKSDDAPAH